jgi:hypothetical protein
LDVLKNIGDSIGSHRTVATDITLTGLNIKLNGGNPGTILAPVMLFFHQKIQLVKAVQRGAVLFFDNKRVALKGG